MKKTLALPLLAAASLASAPAFAGSMDTAPSEPVIQPAAPAPVAPASPNWTGFYAGGQLGYANIDSNAAGVDGDGAIGGLTAGYDYDLGNWVLGAGLDYDWTDINLGGAATLENVWRAKLRGGYKIGNGLLYGTGGYAGADTDTLGSEDGYFVGAGYEHAVTESFNVGGEVLYHEFENFGATTTDVEATTVQVRGTFRF
ncbi:outer membrane protein [Roseovarius sp. MMSF_3281]|uniref:outer membrane protein n=1 Tax=Roseovarius sp. MMSF_3281 TaxID=3046694 RepID=UPI00273F5BCC|nr:outer membrane beta-barrel protein [Roseovarius sp. MMSF_3281]